MTRDRTPRSTEEISEFWNGLMTIEQAAEYRNTTVRHLRHLRGRDEIAYTLIGRLLRFRRSDLDEWLDLQTVWPGDV